MKEYIISILFGIGFVIALTIYMNYFKNSGLRVLEKWAEKEGYKILEAQFRWVKTGPYFISGRSRIQRIFYVSLEDKEGKQSKAWVKIGGFLLGLLSNEIDVKWENNH